MVVGNVTAKSLTTTEDVAIIGQVSITPAGGVVAAALSHAAVEAAVKKAEAEVLPSAVAK